MALTQHEALCAYARMMNSLNADLLEPLLAEDFAYESQMVFTPLESKAAFLAYIRPKLETIRSAGAQVLAEIGTVAAYGSDRPCVVLAQGSKENLVGIVLAEVHGEHASRLDLCIVPPPQAAERSGEYPK